MLVLAITTTPSALTQPDSHSPLVLLMLVDCSVFLNQIIVDNMTAGGRGKRKSQKTAHCLEDIGNKCGVSLNGALYAELWFVFQGTCGLHDF